ncbi:T9SS type A sorting domain-containing protein [Dyadobacter aurulentus]|uniref:T9SS type A sorting domain-containing protein n=1 Tax=Dyadobacter sp. UC 10 TaxID=2605428 RepID=UPI0011F406D8|nr:T9SS type A sorting domain-containing protein [Dyadobacter sp. UC 10]KAA0991733.1 hypothetical protein FXO21_16925 [Dyadobacter sp. UC 10]
MKNLLKSIAFTVAFTFVFVANTFAADKETKKVTSFGTGIFASKSGNIHISVDKYADCNAIVLVTNDRGQVMFREIIGKNTEKFRKALNVKNLPSGIYTIQISGKGEKLTKTFELSEQPVERVLAIK